MKYHYPEFVPVTAAMATTVLMVASVFAATPPAPLSPWSTVVNNGDFMPTDTCDPANPATPPCRTFNSYNQPSVNAKQMVVIRARSRGGQGLGEPAHGVFTRDMAVAGPVVKVLDRDTLVPQPNNRDTEFVEPPSFPRIDIGSDTVASRGNHPPVWKVLDPVTGETLEQLGTTGVYTNPFDDLITGASKLGGVPEFSFFEVPEAPGTPFDVFPGAPAVTGGATVKFKGERDKHHRHGGKPGATIVFKGNYTLNLVGKTGVYYRDLVNEPIYSSENVLAPAGGTKPVVLIANSTDTLIPGTSTVFGSTAPPSAAYRQAVFAGFDNEENPTLGGIYLAPLDGRTKPRLKTLVRIGARVPDEPKQNTFNRLGEGVSFDGRFVAFWGAWGSQTTTLNLQCPTEGNADRIIFCNQQHPNGLAVQVPVHQGIFVHDTKTKRTRAIAKSPANFSDFVYWNFSGRVPGTGEGDDDGELARWRSASFVAVSGLVDGKLNDATFHTAFKARTGSAANGGYVDPVDGIYLRKGPAAAGIVTVVQSGMDGTLLDPEAVYDDDENPATPAVTLPVTEMGIERDGFRGRSLVINASMGTEEAGWAGIYLTRVLR